MIIAGNSHVSVFKHGLRLPAKPHEKVAVHWVGALEIEHFSTNHPAAQKIRALFEQEAGWRILLLGNHDVFKLAASGDRNQELAAMLAQYREAFREFSAQGRFAWMIGLQQTHNVAIPGVTEQDLMRLSEQFISCLSSWCYANQIPVINPMARILDETGRPAPSLLMADQLHLNPEAAPLYCEVITAETGEEIVSNQSEGPDFEPQNEPESFCSLVLTELCLPVGGATCSPDDPAFAADVLAFIADRLADRGLEVSLTEDSDFVSTGLMDSLDLVETYAFATDWLAIDIPFDVNLWELGTVRKLTDFLRARVPQGITHEGPSWQDFLISMREDFASPDGRARLLASEQRIAALPEALARQLTEVVQTVTGGYLGYGLMLYWMALIEHRLGNLERALGLLDKAQTSPKPEPLTLERLEHYRSQWLMPAPSGDLPYKRTTNFLLVDDGFNRLSSTVERFLQTFAVHEDVVLHVLSERPASMVEGELLETIHRLGHDPAAIPDISLVSLPAGIEVTPYIQQVDFVIGKAEVVSQARRHCIPAYEDVSNEQLRQCAERSYLVSAIISAYNSERFLVGRLDNLINQTLYKQGKLEIIIIDSASPQDEGTIADVYMQRHAHIRYLRTAERETVYGAWNRGIELARGRYWINANSDDRFGLEALELMASALDQDPMLDAVYGDWAVTQLENDNLESETPKFVFTYPDFHPPLLLYYQITSHAALIRKSAFAQIGGFDPTLKVFGDREWMLRFATAGLKAAHLPHVVGLYLESPTSVERSESVGAAEFARLRETFTAPDALAKLFGSSASVSPCQLAQLYALAGSLGHRFYEWRGTPVSDYGYAAHLFTLALSFDPDNVVALSNLAIVHCLVGEHARALELLAKASNLGSVDAKEKVEANRLAAERGLGAIEQFMWLHSSLKSITPPNTDFQTPLQGESRTGHPLVSIIVPTYNRPAMLCEAVQSILDQTYPSLEIIVVNDGGIEVEAYLQRLAAPQLTYIRCGRNHERSYARNLGLKVARGKYIAYLDDDDRFYPDHIETLVTHLETHDCQVAYSDALMAHQVKCGDRYHTTKRELVYSNDFDLQRLLVHNVAPTLCFMHERACLETVGLFDESLSTHEDWEFWLRLATRFKVQHVAKVTAEFSWRTDGSSTVSSRRATFLQSLEEVYARYRHLATPETLVAQERYRDFQWQEAEKLGQRYAVTILLRTGDKPSTQQTLEAIARHTTGEYEVILLNDQRHPELQELLKTLDGDVKIISDPELAASATAFNRAAELAEGHYLVFLASGFEPQAGWLETLQRALDGDAGLAAVGGLHTRTDGSIAHAGLLVMEVHDSYRRLEVRAVPEPIAHPELQALTAIGMLVRKSAFNAIGGFNEPLSGHLAGADLCMRLHAKRQRLSLVPESRITVRGDTEWPGPEEAAWFTQHWIDRLIPDRLITEAGVERPHPKHSRVSLVVVTYNSSDTIEACVRSAIATMGPLDEILVVDNASQDDTPEILRSLAAQDKRVRCFYSGENLGFSAGSNLGIQRAKGDYVVLLNPDTVVFAGWLDHMLGMFLLPGVGAVGPTSDYVAGRQKWPLYAPELPLDAPADEIATRLAERNANQGVESKLLIGFCLMLSREVLDKVGLLDEELFLGNDDLDLSWRLRQSGYRLVVATGAFVHHVGQVSFSTEPGERTKRLVQESTDALARKLVRHYGPGFVPTPMELWEMSWFSPAPGILEGIEPETASPLPDRRGFNIVLADPDADRLRATLSAYVSAFTPESDVALHVLAGKVLPEVEERVLEVLDALGASPEAIPDVSLLDAPTDPAELPAYMQAADLVIGTSQTVRRATELGLKALEWPDPDALRSSASDRPPAG